MEEIEQHKQKEVPPILTGQLPKARIRALGMGHRRGFIIQGEALSTHQVGGLRRRVVCLQMGMFASHFESGVHVAQGMPVGCST